MFSSWENFLKVAGENVEGEDEEHEATAASTRRLASRKPDAKEACSLM